MVAEKTDKSIFIGYGACSVINYDCTKLMLEFHCILKTLDILRNRCSATGAGRQLRVKWCVAFFALHGFSS